MSFKDIKGQDRPIEILKGYIEQGKLSGGYLFAGPEGIGKKMVARALAKAVNCEIDLLDTSHSLSINGERSRTIDSCDRCASCLKIDKNQHPDIHIVSSENNEEIKIEYIRRLRNDISFKPYEARIKVFIIDNAHRANPEAQNALLKILEEPPRNSLIILISDKPALLFKTIISRCKIVRFSPLTRPGLKEVFKKDYSLDNDSSHFLAYFSEGRLGRGLGLSRSTIFNTAGSRCAGKDTDILREKNSVIDKFVLSPRGGFEDFSMKEREKVRTCLNILATWFRDIYMVKIGLPHSEIINFDRKSELLKVMSRFSFLDLNEILDSISDSAAYLDQNINIKLLLQNLISFTKPE